MELIDLEKLVDFATYHDLDSDNAEGTDFDPREYAAMLEENGGTEDSYKRLLLCLLNEKSKIKSLIRQRERENDDNAHELDCDRYTEEEGKDLNYRLFLKSLRAHGKSYVIQEERNGIPLFIKYEGDRSPDEGGDLEYKRKSRSGTKKNKGSSRKDEIVNLSRRKSRNRAVGSERVEKEKKSMDEIVPDSDYDFFLKNFRIVEDRGVFDYGDRTVVYEMSDGERNREREDDEDDDDVEILEGTDANSNPFVAVGNDVRRNSEFRRQLMSVLRKPYDKDEYEKLWFDIEFRKAEERHIELRHGRERSRSINKCGKSYLDYHPDLRRKLTLYDDDRPKRLNLLRGFFFWIQKASQNGSFQPWRDAECLAINPESG